MKSYRWFAAMLAVAFLIGMTPAFADEASTSVPMSWSQYLLEHPGKPGKVAFRDYREYLNTFKAAPRPTLGLSAIRTGRTGSRMETMKVSSFAEYLASHRHLNPKEAYKKFRAQQRGE